MMLYLSLQEFWKRLNPSKKTNFCNVLSSLLLLPWKNELNMKLFLVVLNICQFRLEAVQEEKNLAHINAESVTFNQCRVKIGQGRAAGELGSDIFSVLMRLRRKINHIRVSNLTSEPVILCNDVSFYGFYHFETKCLTRLHNGSINNQHMAKH